MDNGAFGMKVRDCLGKGCRVGHCDGLGDDGTIGHGHRRQLGGRGSSSTYRGGARPLGRV